MNRNKRNRKPRSLELKKETVTVLGEAALGRVVGGMTEYTDGNSVHLSMCDCQTH
ncbi:MAG TPA: hypothetical protein VFK02_13965 [Kofleriaceae bacterium]|nr:hypothetical protein [Kofleriaceae bacterium]